MSTPTSTVLDRVVKNFHYADSVDALSGAMTNTSLQLNYTGILPSWGIGMVIEIGTEMMLVTSVDITNKVATIVRGWLGTDKVSHATGEAIYINPRIARSDILGLVNNALIDMYPTIYDVGRQQMDYNSGLIGHPLDGTGSVFNVSARMNAITEQWATIRDWTVEDQLPVADYPTGRGLMIRTSLPNDSIIIVSYEKPFSPVTAETDDLEADAGLADYMGDLPFYFSMNRLMVQEEIERSQIKSASAHQRAQDVPAFLALRTGEWYQARYQDLLRSIRARLIKEHKRTIGAGYGS